MAKPAFVFPLVFFLAVHKRAPRPGRLSTAPRRQAKGDRTTSTPCASPSTTR